MGHFAPGDQKASFVAIFILYLFWWATYLPTMFYSYFCKQDDEKIKVARAHKANERARDGVLLLTTSVLIAFAGQSNNPATNALSYIFLGLWTILLLLTYLTDARKPLVLLELLAISLLVAMIIVTWATAAGRYLVR